MLPSDERQITSTQHPLIGVWDLVASGPAGGCVTDTDLVGLMTCLADGTFTFQSCRRGHVVSCWGRFQVMPDDEVLLTVEWDSETGTQGERCFQVVRCDRTHLVVAAGRDEQLLFDR